MIVGLFIFCSLVIALLTAVQILFPQKTVFNLNQYKEKVDQLSDLLIWYRMREDGIIVNKDGSFQKTFKFRGHDLDSATRSEMMNISFRLNNVLKRLGSGWAIFVDADRVKSEQYRAGSFPDPITYLIDKECERRFLSGDHFESHYYLTLLYLPPAEMENRLNKIFIGTETTHDSAGQHLNNFKSEVTRIRHLFSELLYDFRELTPQETLTFLHSTISLKKHPVKVEIPIYLDAQLADTPVTTGFEPILGDPEREHEYLKVIGIKTYTGPTTPGLLDNLNSLGFEYRWSTRFIFNDKDESNKEVTSLRRKWLAKRKSMISMLKEAITGHESLITDSDALNKSNEADLAAQMLAEDTIAYGYYTCVVSLRDKDATRAAKKAEEVEKTINSMGFTAIQEGMNSFEAWLGSVPGHARQNVRRPLISSYNLAHLLPISAIWAGNATNDHLDDQPPLAYCETSGHTPFRVNTNIKDVGHAMVLGPTGAGKSTFLAKLAASFRKYKNAQVYCFDKGYAMLPLTMGAGGEFYDIANPDAGLTFQPLANIDQPGELSWANEWILDILRAEGVDVTPGVKDRIWRGLSDLSHSEKELRTISGLINNIQDESLRDALRTYSINGSLGRLLDSTHDSLSTGTWQCFEMGALMNIKTAIMPVLTYLFHRLEQRFRKGFPAILILDEAWKFLDNPLFAEKIREWLKELRKNDVYVIFATQSLADAEQSSILSTLIESCPTVFYLPNAKAGDDNVRKVYERFGLNEKQIEILSLATPKRHYLYNSPLGSRIFELGLDEFALAYCTSRGKESYDEIMEIIKTHGKEGFNDEWLRRRSSKLHKEYRELMEREEGRRFAAAA